MDKLSDYILHNMIFLDDYTMINKKTKKQKREKNRVQGVCPT